MTFESMTAEALKPQIEEAKKVHSSVITIFKDGSKNGGSKLDESVNLFTSHTI